HWLYGRDNAVERMPKVQYYTVGADRWQTADVWPPRGTRTTTLFLDSGGHANGLSSDGLLTIRAPKRSGRDTFEYDPTNPVPSAPGAGSYDQRAIEKRADVLVYTSAPLAHGFEITGNISVTLYASSSTRDTDFTAKLVDVFPDGRAF